jgi:effector-binding domain-containing protein
MRPRRGRHEAVLSDGQQPAAARRRDRSWQRPRTPKANDTQIQHRDPQPVLSVRARVPVAELAAAQGEALRELWSHLHHHGGRPAGPPYVRYHSFGDTETDMEVGIPVAAGAVGQGRVAAGELPGGTVVSAWHLGAHDRLGDAYAGLQAWLTEHGHQPAGPGWEVYHWIDLDQEPDPARWPDPSNWRTQLIQPIS